MQMGPSNFPSRMDTGANDTKRVTANQNYIVAWRSVVFRLNPTDV